jgi:chromatin assembly factor 1 subunit A
MSEKKLKQSRLPFQILTSPKTPSIGAIQSVEKSSSLPSTPKTPKPISSRKRKPSSEGENLRSTKIGRLAKSKENIAEPETIEVADSDDDEKKQTLPAVETTPTLATSTSDSVIHIKLPSTTKSRRKQDLKVSKSVEEEIVENDDSIVYLDQEELPAKSSKKAKKGVKKSEKKKKSKAQSSSDEGIERVKKSLKMNDDEKIDEKTPKSDDVEIVEDEKAETDPVAENESSKEEEIDDELMEVDDEPQPAESTVSDQISKLINASGTSSSPVKDMQDILSDDENDQTSPNDQSLNTSVDNKGTPRVLTPKQMARRKEFEEKRLEKELQKKKEREVRELQRLKEKEEREEAKRREKEAKEEERRKEKEEREVKFIKKN